MKKILLGIFLLVSLPLYAMTVAISDGFDIWTSSQVSTTANNTSDTFNLGRYQSGAFQCVWASVTGTQPAYKLQVSNNNSNWDDVSSASTTTTSSSGSGTWLIQPIISQYARIYVSTTSTTGTLNCIAVLQGQRS